MSVGLVYREYLVAYGDIGLCLGEEYMVLNVNGLQVEWVRACDGANFSWSHMDDAVVMVNLYVDREADRSLSRAGVE